MSASDHYRPQPAAFPHLSQTCWCATCDSEATLALPRGDVRILMRRMNLCPTCGNKRCPKAMHHDNACTGSTSGRVQASCDCFDVLMAERERHRDHHVCWNSHGEGRSDFCADDEEFGYEPCPIYRALNHAIHSGGSDV